VIWWEIDRSGGHNVKGNKPDKKTNITCFLLYVETKRGNRILEITRGTTSEGERGWVGEAGRR
jgi:hypothetical protein